MTLDERRQRDLVRFWRAGAREDGETAEQLIRLRRRTWGLFLYHLAIEKLLKAHVVRHGEMPPPTHDLERLMVLAELDLLEEYRAWLREITTYNIRARYDTAKRSFARKATTTYTRVWLHRCHQIFQWLDDQLD